MDQKANSQKPRRRNGARGVRETFVMVAMTLVIAALGIGLFVHFELSVGLAAGVALIAFVALLSMHLLMRRNADVAYLEAEIHELKAQLAQLQRGPSARHPAETPAATAAPSAPAKLDPATEELAAAISSSMPAPLAPLQRPDQPSQAAPAPAGAKAPPPPSAQATPLPAKPAAHREQPEAAPSAPSAPPAAVLPPPAPPVVNKATPLPAPPRDPDQILIVTSPASSAVRPIPVVPPVVAPAPRPVAAAAPAPKVQKPVPPEAAPVVEAAPAPTATATPAAPAPVATPSSAEADALMAPYWAVRPGAAGQLPAAPSAEPPPPVAAAPSLSPATPANGPSLESMQNLIDQLSVQLKAPADPAPAPLPQAANDAIIKDSIAALRRTSEMMRQPESAGPDAAAADQGPPVALPSVPYSRLAIVAEAVAANRIDLCLDPILALEGRKPRHFEVSVRLRSDDGLELSAEDVIEDIQGTGLLARLDAAKLTRTADIAQRLERRGTGASLFANLSRESLADDSFLDTFADTFIDREPLCSRLVLAFAQRDVRDFAEAHWDAVSTMAELGFRFALEHVTDLDMDFEDLRARGFEFIKLDSAVFLRGMPSGETTIPSADICRHMAAIGLGLIVGGIVHERDLARIMEFGVVFGQGTLFGAPRSVTLERSAA